jgi:hypothetical protein
MPLVISTTNSTGLDLVAIVDKVDTDGVDVSPALRWDPADDAYAEIGTFGSITEAFIQLQESATIDGFYEAVVADIDGAAENVRITVLNDATDVAIGVLYNIPLPLVNPEVSVDLTITEDRD